MVESRLYHCVLGSRILGGYALKGGMPVWKYVANRFLTFVENILIGAKLSESVLYVACMAGCEGYAPLFGGGLID